MELESSRRDEMNAWTRVWAAESDGEGRRRVMFLRWKKAVLVIWFIWGRDERVG